MLYLLTDHVDGALLKIEPGEVNQSKLDAQYLELSEQGITSPELFTGSDCMLCHRVDESLIGPSFQEIAAKYSTSQSNLNLLINSILEGGEGNWGDLPMSAHPNISATTARQMVDQILGLSTQ